MDTIQIARKILEGENLENKLIDFSIKETLVPKNYNQEYFLKRSPARNRKIQFSSEQLKFPKKGSLHLPEKRAVALHFFANHELMAIEMMAAAILIFPTLTERDVNLKKGLLLTILDEQKHLKLYIERMNELGLEFGDLPLNDFFWRYMDNIKSPEEFYSVVALTFEAANLDFAKYYQGIFEEVGDVKTSEMMNTVYLDEISHVSRGQKWLTVSSGGPDIWLYYCSLLPLGMTPDRAKGMIYDREGRRRAGLSEDFISNVLNYKSGFKITDRKEWKS